MMTKDSQILLDLLKKGKDAWHEWRGENLSLRLDFIGANLSGMNLSGLNLRDADMSRTTLDGADLSEADLSNVRLWKAYLRNANLSHAYLKDAYLYGARLHQANLDRSFCEGATFARAYLNGTTLRNANLSVANFNATDLSGADLSGSTLVSSTFVNTNLTEANLTDCSIFGISAWGAQLHNTKQKNLLITSEGQPKITVDNLEIAQFIYLLLNNTEIREVIDTVAKKAVLILGRFTPPRRAILDALRKELREYHNYVPIVFDFDKPDSRDTFETLTTLARLARFVIADITNPRSIPGELVSIVESLPSLPVQPILRYGSKPWGMYDHIRRYPWVLELQHYRNLDDLLPSLRKKVIEPAEQKAQELEKR